MRRWILAFVLLLAMPATGTYLQAQDEPADAEPQGPVLNWQPGPMKYPIGSDLAEVDVPDEFLFLDAEDTRTFMELLGNPTNGSEMATVAPSSEDEGWFIVFEWDPVGWVDDSEKDDLAADELLESIRQGTEQANEVRRERGWSTLEITGWFEEPRYDERTNNLTWAIEGVSDGAVVLNRLTKLLGRRGVMSATLVCSPEELATVASLTDQILDGYSFQTGNRYADFIPGSDTVAKYGLTALVAGGAGAALAKSGLLSRIWKFLVFLVVAGFAGLRRLFGGRSAEAGDQEAS